MSKYFIFVTAVYITVVFSITEVEAAPKIDCRKENIRCA